MERRYAEKDLARDWDKDWGGQSGQSETIQPPVDKPSELVDYLVEIGVFRLRPEGRIDVPDLFLNGLGMTRKGGVARR